MAWDAEAEEWEAISEVSGQVLHGKTERDLALARNAVVVTLADELRAIIQYAPQHGYSPPRI